MSKTPPKQGKRRVGRPLANPEGPTTYIGATVPESLVAKLDRIAAARRLNRSGAVCDLIRRATLRPKKSGR